MNKKILKITTVAAFVTLVAVFSYIRIPLGEGSIHLGNSMCLLSGLVISPFWGGFASGLGSLIFDLYAHPSVFSFEFLITFFTKFMMAFVCGVVFRGLEKILSKTKYGNVVSIVLSGTVGEIAYIILYLLKSYLENIYIIGLKKEVVIPILIGKMSASIINAIFAIIMSCVFYNVITKKGIRTFFDKRS